MSLFKIFKDSKMKLFAILLISINLISISQANNYYDSQFCSWLQQNYGFGCNGPVQHWIWERYQKEVNNIKDCNELCIRVRHRMSGRCVQSYGDRSMWCPTGQRCDCY